MNRLTRIGVAAALAAASALAFSQAPGAGGPGGPPPGGGARGAPPSPEAVAKTAIEARQSAFRLIQNQNGAITTMMRGEFNAALAARNAVRIQTLAEMLPELFTPDTRPITTVKTRALEGIWTNQADFKVKADALAKAAADLAAAAKTGDKAAVQAAMTKLGPACGSCHDAYRGPP